MDVGEMGVIVVTGTPGAGKTTVLKEALERSKGYDVLNYGDEIIAYATAEEMAKVLG